MAKEIKYKGKIIEELNNFNQTDLIKLLPSRIRRSLKRGFTDQQKRFLIKLEKHKNKKTRKLLKTHCRDLAILPSMIGQTIHVHNGKTYVPVIITIEMLGHYLGEYSLTRNKVTHSAPGIGATKSSGALSVK